jgi:hypothetical protein
MDTTKPYGEACTPDGGLKEAHEIEWFHDPDDKCPMTNHKSAVNQRSFWFSLLRFTRLSYLITPSDSLSLGLSSIPLLSLPHTSCALYHIR